MNTKLLTDIGLTQGEIKVYFALLNLGQTTTGPIADEANVSRSKLYVILDKLTKKGLVGHVIKAKTKYFSAMDPKNILDFMDDKNRHFREQRAAVEHMIPEIDLKIKMKGQKTEATLFEGLKAIKNFYLNILKELKAGEEYYVIGATYGTNHPALREFYQSYHEQRAAKRIKVKMLANQTTKDNLVSATYKNAEVRFLPQYLITNMTIIFYKNKSFIFFLTEEPKGFLMESDEAVKSFRAYFDAFWKIAETK